MKILPPIFALYFCIMFTTIAGAASAKCSDRFEENVARGFLTVNAFDRGVKITDKYTFYESIGAEVKIEGPPKRCAKCAYLYKCCRDNLDLSGVTLEVFIYAEGILGQPKVVRWLPESCSGGRCRITDREWFGGLKLDQGDPKLPDVPDDSEKILGLVAQVHGAGTSKPVRVCKGKIDFDTSPPPKPLVGPALPDRTSLSTIDTRESCWPLDRNRLQVAFTQGEWRLVEGTSWVLSFGSGGQAEENAHEAKRIIDRFRFDEMCGLNPPSPEMMYFKAAGRVPSGADNGLDCFPVDRATLVIEGVPSSWKLISGIDGSNGIHQAFDRVEEVASAAEIINHYRLNRQCFVGRPNAEMTYWLAE